MDSTDNQSKLSRRLRALPGQFLLALINGTAVLIIIAALLVIVAFNRVENAAGNISATMTESVLAKFDLGDRRILTEVEDLRAEVAALVTAITEEREAIVQAIDAQREAMSQTVGEQRDELVRTLADQTEAIMSGARIRLDALQAELVLIRLSIEGVGQASSVLVDTAIRKMGDSITNGLLGLRHCEPVDSVSPPSV